LENLTTGRPDNPDIVRPCPVSGSRTDTSHRQEQFVCDSFWRVLADSHGQGCVRLPHGPSCSSPTRGEPPLSPGQIAHQEFRAVILFGSRAKNEAASGLDLALVITEGPDQYQLAEYFSQREIWATSLATDLALARSVLTLSPTKRYEEKEFLWVPSTAAPGINRGKVPVPRRPLLHCDVRRRRT
jgi:hypothetical protein